MATSFTALNGCIRLHCSSCIPHLCGGSHLELHQLPGSSVEAKRLKAEDRTLKNQDIVNVNIAITSLPSGAWRLFPSTFLLISIEKFLSKGEILGKLDANQLRLNSYGPGSKVPNNLPSGQTPVLRPSSCVKKKRQEETAKWILA